MPRIVSLIASATEIVDALGMTAYLVGRSHECDSPELVKALPVCTRPRIPVDGSSREIDALVKDSARTSVSIYDVFDDVIGRLEPTHIVTQIQCEVCAVSLRDVEEALSCGMKGQPRIVSLQPDSLAQIWEDFRRVARALGIPDRGEAVVAALQARMVCGAGDWPAAQADSDARGDSGGPLRRERPRDRGEEEPAASTAARTGADSGGVPGELPHHPSSPAHRSRVACIEWIEPLMAAGNWTPELIEMAGGINLFGEAGRHSPWMTWEQLAAADPDMIVIAPCGFDLARTEREMYWLTDRPDWKNLRAVESGRVYLADGNQYFNRPGPRVVETFEILAEILHPEIAPRHRGRAWRALAPGAI
jgi:iron complex transport system substrate-binding protein